MFGQNLDILQSILLLMSLICFDFVPIGNLSEVVKTSCLSFSFRGAVLLTIVISEANSSILILGGNVGISTGRDYKLELIRKGTSEERSQSIKLKYVMSMNI